jgi:rhodanese-related sulfurtransferase
MLTVHAKPHDLHHAAPELSLTELKALVDAKTVFVVDANSDKMYGEAHIPGALHYKPVEGKLASALPKDKKALIVFYCGGPLCTAWEAPAKEAVAAGYTNLKHLKAGIKGWREAKYATAQKP